VPFTEKRASEIRVLLEAMQELDRELLDRVLTVARERDLDPAALLRLVGQGYQSIGFALLDPDED
jgi:hypothetical protein